MGANGRWAGLSSRWAIAIAIVVLLATGLLVLSLTGGGDQSPSADPVPVVQSSDPTPPDRAPSSAGDEAVKQGGPGREQANASGDEEEPRHAGSDAGGGDGQRGSGQGSGGDAGRESESEDETPVADCPPGLTAEQCRAAAEALAEGGSKPYDAEDCPPAFTAGQCRAAAEALAEGGSKPYDAEDCPPAFTAEQCRAAGEALRAGS